MQYGYKNERTKTSTVIGDLFKILNSAYTAQYSPLKDHVTAKIDSSAPVLHKASFPEIGAALANRNV